jgi:hypothetical protein
VSGVTGRFSNVEYQGPTVRPSLAAFYVFKTPWAGSGASYFSPLAAELLAHYTALEIAVWPS